MPAFFVVLLGFYIAGLFALAWLADKRGGRSRAQPLIYALSLAALCSSWTYFGAVGLATQDGWAYLPNFLGPVLGITLFFPIWRRIAVAAKHENSGSIADFLSSRYGKSRQLGVLVACTAIVGALPYIALQLAALSKAWTAVSGQPEQSLLATPAIVVALAFFAILLGARWPNLTHHNRGLVRVVAVESTVKLVALLSVAALGVYLVLRANDEGFGAVPSVALGALAEPPRIDLTFLTSTMLCLVTAVTLPRLFHLTFVELREQSDLAKARWLLPGYMLLWSGMVAVIAIAAPPFLPPGGDPDLIVLTLPQTYGGPVLTALAYLGGFSAGAAMVMMETVALSAMISNELILPSLAKLGWTARRRDIAGVIVAVRRGAMIAMLVLAYLYYISFGSAGGLAQLGFTSLAASAQLFPSLVGAVFWRRGHARGAICGLIAGMAVWLVTIVAPGAVGYSAFSWLGSWAVGGTAFELGVILSLALNTTVYVGVSLVAKPRLVDRIQASAFVGAERPIVSSVQTPLLGTVGDLRSLLEQFLGRDDGRSAFDVIVRRRQLADGDPIDPEIARSTERMLAGAIGASSARRVLTLTLANDGRDASSISDILDEAAHAVHFSRELLHVTLESLDQGICVVDSDLRLVAWNTRFLALQGFTSSQVFIGKSLEELIRFGAIRDGDEGEQIERTVEERVVPILRGEPVDYCGWRNGLTFKITGAPMGNGDYVTSFTDVSELVSAVRSLAQANDLLEQRVELRTSELTATNAALAQAKASAEKVTRSQARFVAAASHDLRQPMHAARLFLGTALEGLNNQEAARELLAKADLSIDAADKLMRALLNLSRLEVDGVPPEFDSVDVSVVLGALRREFEPTTRARGLRFRVLAREAWVRSDPDLLRSVLQNLIGNAVRYTPTGGAVVICCREGEGAMRIEVRDSGPGIPEHALSLIFEEFARLDQGTTGGPGAGLGLAIADRICRALGHKLGVRTKVGRGSVFSVTLAKAQPKAVALPRSGAPGMVSKLRVLCIDDEAAVLDSTVTLMRRWGMEVTPASSAAEARALMGDWDVILADYHLMGETDTGLDLLADFVGRAPVCALVTADPTEAILQRTAEIGVEVLRKPLAPATLRAYLSHSLYSAEAVEAS